MYLRSPWFYTAKELPNYWSINNYSLFILLGGSGTVLRSVGYYANGLLSGILKRDSASLLGG